MRLLEKLKVSKGKAKMAREPDDKQGSEDGQPKATNGEGSSDGSKTKDVPEEETGVLAKANGDKSSSDILADVKLFVIFHEQVMNLVNAQKLPIQDTTALLVSLANLAL